jgi:hypothetical protein
VDFATGGEIASFIQMIQFDHLKRLVLKSRPDLEGKVSTRLNTVMIDLPPHNNDPCPRVVLGSVTRGTQPRWLILGNAGFTLKSSVWDLSTSEECLVHAALEMYAACVEERAVSSPWRWAESEQSPIVEAAEILSHQGHDVEAVASTNRLVPDPIEGNDPPSSVPVGFGDALRIKLDRGVATLARKPTLGWVLDVSNHFVTRRLDLGFYSTGETSTQPGLQSEDIAEVVRAVERALAALPWGPLEGTLDALDVRLEESPLHHAVAWWMRELGYPGTYASELRPDVVSSVKVKVMTKKSPAGLADVQRAFAQATVEEMKLCVFSAEGFTRSATRWADTAGAPLFNIWGDEYRLTAANSQAQERMPTIM